MCWYGAVSTGTPGHSMSSLYFFLRNPVEVVHLTANINRSQGSNRNCYPIAQGKEKEK